jgi:hypothetical protein
VRNQQALFAVGLRHLSTGAFLGAERRNIESNQEKRQDEDALPDDSELREARRWAIGSAIYYPGINGLLGGVLALGGGSLSEYVRSPLVLMDIVSAWAMTYNIYDYFRLRRVVAQRALADTSTAGPENNVSNPFQ